MSHPDFKNKGDVLMKVKLVLSLLALLALSAIPCQSAPKHFYQDKKWWLGEAVIVTSVILDAHSTCRSFAHGGVETGPALSGNTSCGVEKGVAVGAFGFYTALHIGLWDIGHDDPSRFWRTVSYWAMPSVAAGIHVPAAIHNYRLKTPAAICTDPDRDCERKPDLDHN
jgi:hypothetical protein